MEPINNPQTMETVFNYFVSQNLYNDLGLNHVSVKIKDWDGEVIDVIHHENVNDNYFQRRLISQYPDLLSFYVIGVNIAGDIPLETFKPKFFNEILPSYINKTYGLKIEDKIYKHLERLIGYEIKNIIKHHLQHNRAPQSGRINYNERGQRRELANIRW
jgi:hypothetical protein